MEYCCVDDTSSEHGIIDLSPGRADPDEDWLYIGIGPRQWPNPTQQVVWNVWRFVLLYAGPLFVFVFGYWKILAVVRRQRKQVGQSQPARTAAGAAEKASRQTEMNVIKTVVLVSVSFAVCFVGIRVYTILTSLKVVPAIGSLYVLFSVFSYSNRNLWIRVGHRERITINRMVVGSVFENRDILNRSVFEKLRSGCGSGSKIRRASLVLLLQQSLPEPVHLRHPVRHREALVEGRDEPCDSRQKRRRFVAGAGGNAEPFLNSDQRDLEEHVERLLNRCA